MIQYTKTHPITKQKYVGRTSGTSDPFKNIEIRDKHHHKNKEGFGPARLDKSSDNPDAIRGQEQFMIDQVGGAQSHGGTSGNKINGISSNNPNRKRYEEERRKEFGEEP